MLQPDGAPIDAVSVRAAARGVEQSAQTDAEGRFSFATLGVGVYSLALEKVGLTPLKVDSVLVSAARNEVGPYTMTPGGGASVALDGGPAGPPTPAAVAVQPVEAQPVEAQPVEVQPVGVQPVGVQPVGAQPVEAQQVEAQQVEAQPVDAQPVDAQAVEAQPVEAQPVEAQPVEAQPVEAQPVVWCPSPSLARLKW
ncbi:MAG: carboxypeptidase regulatory-like domain-containing protein [Myxococcus sp.]|nr:carboxypeptidase regulatory-like domain-containing protein [Myxococcus sp.]